MGGADVAGMGERAGYGEAGRENDSLSPYLSLSSFLPLIHTHTHTHSHTDTHRHTHTYTPIAASLCREDKEKAAAMFAERDTTSNLMERERASERACVCVCVCERTCE